MKIIRGKYPGFRHAPSGLRLLKFPDCGPAGVLKGRGRDHIMAHKFSIGQAVEYKPVGAKVGYFKVIRQMPEEFQAVDLRYRIKSDQESFERNVLECDLSPSVVPEDQYDPLRPLRRSGGHH